MAELTIQDIVTRPGTYALVFLIFFITEFIRRAVHTLLPHWKKQADENESVPTYTTLWARLWHKVILYAIPVVIGTLCAFLDHSFFWGDLAGEGGGQARGVLGMLIGFLSGYLVKCAKQVIAARTGVQFDTMRPNADDVT